MLPVQFFGVDARGDLLHGLQIAKAGLREQERHPLDLVIWMQAKLADLVLDVRNFLPVAMLGGDRGLLKVVAPAARWLSSEEPLPSIFEVLLASINIMETRITQFRLGLDQPDIIIQPPLGHIRFLEFGRAEEIIAIGYEHTQRQLASLSPQNTTQKKNSPS